MSGMAEVVVRWGETLLEVAHVPPRRAPDAPLEAPAVIERGGRLCCLVPEGARGSLVAHGAYRSLAGLEDDRQLEDVAGARVLVLAGDACARVELGALTYEVRPTEKAAGPAPRSIGAGAVPAWILGSALLHLPLVVMLLLVPPRAMGLRLDSPSERVVAFCCSSPPEPEPETWIVGPGGTGQRHDGSEGALGSREPATPRGRYAIARDERDPEPRLARSRGAVESVGAIGVLNGMLGTWDTPVSPYGASRASGFDERSALGALMGDTIGSSGGADGLGMRGSGRGGGGTGEGTIGLGSLGTLGHGAGCTDGDCQGSGYGRGSGGLAPRESRPPTIRCGGGASGGGCAAEARGGLSREVIRRVVRRHLGEVRFCYEQGLQDDPSLEGRVSVQWIIGADGRVASAALSSSELGDAAVDQCIVSAVRRWSFPTSAGLTGVTYPFTLQAS